MRKNGHDSLLDVMRHEPEEQSQAQPQEPVGVVSGESSAIMQEQQRMQRQFTATALLLLWQKARVL